MWDTLRYQCIPGNTQEMSIGDKLTPQVFHLKDVWDTLIVVLNVKETLCFCVIYMILFCIYLKSMVISKCNIWAINGSARRCGCYEYLRVKYHAALVFPKSYFWHMQSNCPSQSCWNIPRHLPKHYFNLQGFSSAISEYMISNGSETWISKTG